MQYEGFGLVQVLPSADSPDPGADPQAGVLQSRRRIYLLRKPTADELYNRRFVSCLWLITW